MGALLPFVPVGEQTDRSRAQEIVGPYEASVGHIGDSDDDASQSSENYRAARIRFFEIQFVATDPPTTGDSYSGLSMIDTGSGEPRTSPCSLPPIRKDCFLCWIFVTQWNSFIRISARDVALEWMDDLRTSHPASV